MQPNFVEGNARASEVVPDLAKVHFARHGYCLAGETTEERWLYYEGTFDPFSDHHLELFMSAFTLGFERAVLGIVFQNPYKARQPAPYHHRAQMAAIMLQSRGLSLVSSFEEWLSGAKGVYVPATKVEFDYLRENALRHWEAHILIGADNFQKAMVSDTLWCHVPSRLSNPRANELYGFRSLYEHDESFARRVLVPPILFDAHATNVRAGDEALPQQLLEYVETHNLYEIWQEPKEATPLVLPCNTSERSPSFLCAVNLFLDKLRGGLREVHLLNGKIERLFNSVGAKIDRLSYAELLRYLKEESSGEESSRGRRSLSLARLMRQLVTTGILQSNDIDFSSEGGERLLECLDEDKQVLLVGNYSGWGDLVMLSLALENEGLGSLSVAVPADIEHPNSVTQFVFGRSFDDARGHHETRLVFPEPKHSEREMALFSLDRLGLEERADWDNLAIVPLAQIGGIAIGNRLGLKSSYLKSSFGIPLLGEELREIVNEGLPVLPHYIGRCVAELLPYEYRGAYSPAVIHQQEELRSAVHLFHKFRLH